MDAAYRSEIFAPVLDAFRPDAAACFRGPVRLRPDAYQERPYSHLLRVAVLNGESEQPASHVFVKVFKDKPVEGRTDGMRARVERDYATTREIHEAMARWPDLTVVRPVACYPEHLAIITEEARGPSLLQYIVENAAWFPRQEQVERLRVIATNVGRWLRAFQSTGVVSSEPAPIPGGPFSLEGLREYVDVRLQRLVAARQWVNEELRQRILQHIDTLAGELSPADLRRTPIHGDFGAGNIIVGDGRVVVLDFAMVKRGSVFHDLSRLYVQLNVLTAKPQFRSRTIATLQRALLHGYDPEISADRPSFRLLMLMHRINHYATLSLGRERLAARLYSRRVSALHRRSIEAELARDAQPGFDR
jgi:hypothetical protein